MMGSCIRDVQGSCSGGVAAFPRGWPAAPAHPRDVSISPGERSRAQGRAGCVWADSNPQRSRREAEVWGGRGISVTRASPGDSAPATGLCSPSLRAAEAVSAAWPRNVARFGCRQLRGRRAGNPRAAWDSACPAVGGTQAVTGTALPGAAPRQGRRRSKDTAGTLCPVLLLHVWDVLGGHGGGGMRQGAARRWKEGFPSGSNRAGGAVVAPPGIGGQLCGEKLPGQSVVWERGLQGWGLPLELTALRAPLLCALPRAWKQPHTCPCSLAFRHPGGKLLLDGNLAVLLLLLVPTGAENLGCDLETPPGVSPAPRALALFGAGTRPSPRTATKSAARLVLPLHRAPEAEGGETVSPGRGANYPIPAPLEEDGLQLSWLGAPGSIPAKAGKS